jgi:hypothetical protein
MLLSERVNERFLFKNRNERKSLGIVVVVS